MGKIFAVNIGYQTSTPRGALDVFGINSEVFIGNSDDQALYLGNTVRLGLGNVMIAKNLAGVSGSDNYKTIATSTNTGYAGIELRYAGNIAFYGTNGATTANNQFATPVARMWIDGSNGNVGIGTTTPAFKLTVNGSASILGLNMNSNLIVNVGNAISNTDAVNLGQMNAALSVKVGGSGTANYIPVFSNSNSITNSNIYYDGSNIGIGIISGISAKLHVVGNALITAGLNVNGQKITNVAAATNSTDAVNLGQISGLGSKWTLTGTDIYRLSNVIIGNNYNLQMYDTSSIAINILKLNTSNHLELSTPNDLYVLSGGTTRLKVWGGTFGAISIGQQPSALQHALHVEGDTVGNLWTFRAVFRTQKNNNIQIGDTVNTFFAIHNTSTPSVDIGNKAGAVVAKAIYDFQTGREVQHRFDGNQWGDNIQLNRIMARVCACVNTAAAQTQTNCAITFTATNNTANHRFIVTIEGALTGSYFSYKAVVFYASGSVTLTPVTALNVLPNATVSASVVSNNIVITITRTSGNFTYSNLIISTQSAAYVNGTDQAANVVQNITFS